MSLKSYKARTDTFFAGTDAEGEPNVVLLRGLTVEGLSLLMEGHWPQMRSLYDRFKEGDGEPEERLNRIIIDSLRLAPDLAAAIIAVSAGEPDAIENTKSLPFTSQVDALVKITNLTLSEVGGLGNFSAVVQSLAEVMQNVRAAVVPPPASIPDPLASMNFNASTSKADAM